MRKWGCFSGRASEGRKSSHSLRVTAGSDRMGNTSRFGHARVCVRARENITNTDTHTLLRALCVEEMRDAGWRVLWTGS